MPDSKINKTDALVKILNLLDLRRNLTATSMASTLGVGERTIYRYLRSLQLAGYPIYFDTRQMSYRFAEGYQLKRPEFGLQLSDLLELKRCVINSSSVGIAVYDYSGQCILANDAMGGIFGTTQEGVLSRNFRDLAPRKHSGLLEMAEDCVRCEREHHREFHLFIGDRDAWVACTMTPFESRGARYLLLIAHDVTTLRRTETHLRSSKTSSWKILETLPVGIIWSDRSGRVEHMNNCFTERYGWTREDIPTFQDWLLAAYPDPRYRTSVVERWKNLRDKARATGTMTVLMEVTITCKDGTTRQVTITTRLAEHQALAVFTDVAEPPEDTR